MRNTTAVLGFILLALSAVPCFANEEVYYFHNDHLGTPQALSDQSGKIVWTAEYRPFGEAVVNEDPDGDGQRVECNLRFPGQYYDAETGLHYNYMRDYDPGTGRYVEADPIGLAGGINLYEFAQSNPLGWEDPQGLKPGQIFPSAEIAVIDAIDYVFSALWPVKTVEYGGWIRKMDCFQELYYYDEPTVGDYAIPPLGRGVDIGPPPDDTAHVWYHTHPYWASWFRDGEDFSGEDAKVCLRWDSTGYLGTPTKHIKMMPPGPMHGFLRRQRTIR